MPKVRVPLAPWQARLRRDPSRYKCGIGGVGSGKSVGFGEDFIEAITRWPRSQSLIMLGTYKQLKEGALKTFQSRLRHHFGVEGVGYSQNKSDLSITILRGPAKGHRIVMWSAESYESLKSTEYDFVWCDEIQTWGHPEEAISFLFTRQRNSPNAVEAYSQRDDAGEIVPDTCALEWRMWLTANPPHHTSHYLYQRFVERRAPDEEFSFYHVKTADNTLLPRRDEYIARLRRELPPDVFRIEVLGEWGDIGVGRVYTEFYRERATSPDPRLPSLRKNADGSLWKDSAGRHRIAIDDMAPLIWAQDFGVMPRASTIGQVHRLKIKIAGYQDVLVYWHDAIEIPNGSTDLMIKEFVRRYPPVVTDASGAQHRRRVWVFGDPAGRRRDNTTAESDWAYMKRSKDLAAYDITYYFRDAPPLIITRVMETNAKLCNAADEIGTLFDPGDGLDDKRARPLMTDFQSTRWKEGTKLLDHGSPSKGIFRTHLSDCCGYFYDYSFPIALHDTVRRVGTGATWR